MIKVKEVETHLEKMPVITNGDYSGLCKYLD